MLEEGKQYGYIPSHQGSLVFLNADGDLNGTLGRVESTGGQILLPKTSRGECGWTAWIEETQGNRAGLSSMECEPIKT